MSEEKVECRFRRGQVVEVQLRSGRDRGVWVTALCLGSRLDYPKGEIRVSARRADGFGWDGPERCVRPSVAGRDGITGNVYADFLEEHGFGDAAAFLRKAFPLEDGVLPEIPQKSGGKS